MNFIKTFFWKNKIAIGACVLTIAFGIGYWVLSSPGTTSIGEDVTVGNNLDVVGNIVASGTICDSIGCIGAGGSGLWSQSGSDIYYDSGNVGIGTTTPNKLVHLAGSQPTIRLEDTASGNDYWDVLNEDVSGDFRIWGSVLNDNAMVIDTTGYVGIGTTSPQKKLHVRGSIQSSATYPSICLDNTNTGKSWLLHVDKNTNQFIIRYYSGPSCSGAWVNKASWSP